jgi:hypothetical protein
MPTYFQKLHCGCELRLSKVSNEASTRAYPQVVCYDCENRTSSELPEVASRSNLEPTRDTNQ